MNPTISLITPTPQFANDLADVVRIFWGGAQFKVNEPGGEITVTHRPIPERRIANGTNP